jgi:hypothetical protein
MEILSFIEWEIFGDFCNFQLIVIVKTMRLSVWRRFEGKTASEMKEDYERIIDFEKELWGKEK